MRTTLSILCACLFVLRSQAQPKETGPFAAPDLVELIKLEPTIWLDIRYARTDNFIKRQVYTEARAFLQRPAAVALLKVHKELLAKGYGLLIFDGYRPWSVTKLFWDLTPKDKRAFVANPQKGSRHNRGCAVDLSLYFRKTGRQVPMPSDYDETTDRAAPDYKGGTAEERNHRDLLRKTMEAAGFVVEPNEWWHYNYKDCPPYAILDIPFSAIGR